MRTRKLIAPEASIFLLGPRGTGKTTWLRQHFADVATYDLLRAGEHLRLSRDPSVFGAECDALPEGSWIVLDEVQKVPALLDEVQRLIGQRRQRFILSGSSARKLKRGGANLLAGRAEVRNLLPFVSPELEFQRTLGDALRFGMLPMAVDGSRPAAYLRAYAETYLKEEIQSEALVRNLGSFARFLEVAARMNAQTVSQSGVARDAGVARPTVVGYFEILIDTLIAWWLPPWKLKRAAKQTLSPKLYFFDTGVVRQLAGLAHIPIHPEEAGFLFETYLLHEVRAYLHYQELHYPMFHWRTHDGAEVDLLVESPAGLVAIEFKAGERWDHRFARGLHRFRREHPEMDLRMFGVFNGQRPLEQEGVRVLPWLSFLRSLWAGELF